MQTVKTNYSLAGIIVAAILACGSIGSTSGNNYIRGGALIAISILAIFGTVKKFRQDKKL